MQFLDNAIGLSQISCSPQFSDFLDVQRKKNKIPMYIPIYTSVKDLNAYNGSKLIDTTNPDQLVAIYVML